MGVPGGFMPDGPGTDCSDGIGETGASGGTGGTVCPPLVVLEKLDPVG